MKARYQYRFYPTDQQKGDLARMFGCTQVLALTLSALKRLRFSGDNREYY